MLNRIWTFSPLCGLVVAGVVTLGVTVWEWLENPGGIFRDASGTHWNFVAETALSWFGPTFVTATLVALTVHLFWIALRRIRSRHRTGN